MVNFSIVIDQVELNCDTHGQRQHIIDGVARAKLWDQRSRPHLIVQFDSRRGGMGGEAGGCGVGEVVVVVERGYVGQRAGAGEVGGWWW